MCVQCLCVRVHTHTHTQTHTHVRLPHDFCLELSGRIDGKYFTKYVQVCVCSCIYFARFWNTLLLPCYLVDSWGETALEFHDTMSHAGIAVGCTDVDMPSEADSLRLLVCGRRC